MNVGCCSIKFHIHESHSLKAKRRITKAIKQRVKNKFNISIAEIGDQDVWQTLHLGIVAVGSDPQYLEGLMHKIIDAIDRMNLAEIIESHSRVMNLGPIQP